MQGNAQRWIFAAIVYLCVGVALGVYMGASHDHSLFPVHAHVNLLGWVTLALIGVVYHFFPQAGTSRLASVQFWLHNVALVVMMGALAVYLKGNPAIEPLVAVGSIGLLVSVFLFGGNVLLKRA
jgi:cbb3-type cytochrome oxidase subunit 1